MNVKHPVWYPLTPVKQHNYGKSCLSPILWPFCPSYTTNYQGVNPIESRKIPWDHHFPMEFLWFLSHPQGTFLYRFPRRSRHPTRPSDSQLQAKSWEEFVDVDVETWLEITYQWPMRIYMLNKVHIYIYMYIYIYIHIVLWLICRRW